MVDDTSTVQMATPSDNGEVHSPETYPNKRRRRKSIVWEHFTVETVSAGCTRACCKQCKKSFAYITGSKLAGTSHLKRHITLGICPVNRLNQETSQFTPYNAAPRTDFSANGTDLAKKRYRGTPGSGSFSFDQDYCNHAMARMIIQHEYPLHIGEQPGFVDFVRTLQPQFNVANFNTMQAECLGIYTRGKQGLLNLLSEIPGRVSLTLDLWNTNQTFGYLLLTGHFIDADWKLHHCVLTVSVVQSPDSDVAFNHAVAACLSEWNLDSKLFSLTVDSSCLNETVVENLRGGLVSIKNPFLLNGQLVNGNCYAHVLGRLALEALGSMSVTVAKIHESVKYVKISKAHEESFTGLKQRLQVPSRKSLIIDDLLKWDTTYHMLVAACELKEVFSCLSDSDPDYKASLSLDEWKQVEILCTYLKLLFDAANILTATTYPTTNTFFHEVWKIQSELTHAAMNQDPFISDLIKPLQEKFNRYWQDSCLVLAVSVVMDPRFKMKLVEFSFGKVYGETADLWIKIVDESLHQLFLEYVSQTPCLSSTFVEEGNGVTAKTEIPDGDLLLTTGDGLSDFDVYLSEISIGQDMKSELDQYLEESLLPRMPDFDVLNWWKLNKLKYPTLAKMAGDLLSVPMSTVAPDSVFDTVRKTIDSYKSSLRPMTLEALICAKNWLQFESKEFSNSNVKIEY